MLQTHGVSAERVRAEVIRVTSSQDEGTPDQLTFTPLAKKVFELALREALSPGHSYIGTEHILFGLLRETKATGTGILLGFDIDAQGLREDMLRVISDRAKLEREEREAQREATIKTLADFLADLKEVEVGQWLLAAKAGTLPSSFGQFPRYLKRATLMDLLLDADDAALARLRQIMEIAEIEMNAEARDRSQGKSVGDMPNADAGGPIFVVHGHDHAALHNLVRVLERATGRDVIVLHEQPNAGRTILEKFEEHAVSASYSVVLLTADDEGGASSTSEHRPRGRQNVIFELGFFFGKLGRERVAVLLDPRVEKPSDIEGLVYIVLDAGGGWKQTLAKELANVGVDIDYARIP